MQTITLNTGQFLFVEVPEEWKGAEHLWFASNEAPKVDKECHYLFNTSTITEEQAAQIVEYYAPGEGVYGDYRGVIVKNWKDYEKKCFSHIMSAGGSFRSLISAHKLTASNYAVLRII